MGSYQSAGGPEAGAWSEVPTLLAAAHELKSPLVLIRQLSFQLDEHDQTAERIRLTAERTLRLVEGITKVSRLEDTLFECEPIYMPALLEDIAQEFDPLAKALNQSIRIRTSAAQPIAVGNRVLLRAVMMGLCDNALTHNDPSQPIELQSYRKMDRVIMGVRDYGPTTTNLAAIRRRLGKTPAPVENRPNSSGLGLMIAEQFARHMESTLALRRHRDQGATFSLSLPASQQLALIAL